MKSRFMIGLWRFIIAAPPSLWKKQVAKAQKRFAHEKRFMTEDHRRVHHFVVRELPKIGEPMPPEYIKNALDLPLENIQNILADLEEHMTFLVTDEPGRVTWAYPVTVEKTPHRITFSTGEQLFAA